MDDIARIVHKHDGIIWGEYVWSKFNNDIVPTVMNVRFLNLNIFGDLSWPKQFLMDMYDQFDVVKITSTSLYVYRDGVEYQVDVCVNNALMELTFSDEVDFTVNLLDYTRAGFCLRKISGHLLVEPQPYCEVVDHIRNKILRIVNVSPALTNVKHYLSRGWTMDKSGDIVPDLYISKRRDIHKNHYRDVYGGECSICKTEINEEAICARTQCMHVFHVDCLRSWYAKSPTCPMCREKI